MITRPLDLASRLRGTPRNFDWLFFVNAGLIVLFFSLFGSRFVLAPGVTVLPEIAGATARARTTTHYVTVNSAQQIFAGDGLRDLEQLDLWLRNEAKATKDPVLLVLSRDSVELEVVTRIISIAEEAGFEAHIAATEPGRGGRTGRRMVN